MFFLSFDSRKAMADLIPGISQILVAASRKVRLEGGIDMNTLAQRTEGYTGADLQLFDLQCSARCYSLCNRRQCTRECQHPRRAGEP